MAYIGRDIEYGSFTKQTLTANSSSTVFALDQSVVDANSILVSVGGVIQEPDVAYTASGTELTFTGTPTTGDPIWIVYLGKSLGTSTTRDAITYQAATGDGSATTVAMTSSGTTGTIIVTLNGVMQTPSTDFSVSGSTLTFTTAPFNNAAIGIHYLGKQARLGVPASGTIQQADLASSGTFPAWDGSALTGIVGIMKADIFELQNNIALLNFLRANDITAKRTSMMNGFQDQFRQGNGVSDSMIDIPLTKFDGVNDYLFTTTDLTGMADGLQGTFSCWIDFTGGDGVLQQFITNEGGYVQIEKATSNKFHIMISRIGGGGTKVWDALSSTTYTAPTGRLHFMSSWNGTTGTMYVNGVNVLGTNSSNTGTNADYTRSNWSVGADCNGAYDLSGSLGQVYFTNSYIDLTVQANREKFVSGTNANAKPVDFGANGSTPTGSQPLIYLNNNFRTFQDNLGTGGRFKWPAGHFTVDGGYVDVGARAHGEYISNEVYGLPPSTINVPQDSTQVYCSFIAKTSDPITKVGGKSSYSAAGGRTLSASIHFDNNGNPGAPASSIGTGLSVANNPGVGALNFYTGGNWIDCTLPTPFTPTAGTKYWIKLTSTGAGIDLFEGNGGGLYSEGMDMKMFSTSLKTYPVMARIHQKRTNFTNSDDLLYSFGKENGAANATIHGGTTNKWGNAITFASDLSLTKVALHGKKTGSPTGTVFAFVTTVSGTPGTNGTGTDTVLARSNGVDIAQLDSNGPNGVIEFTFPEPFYMAAGNYFIGIDYQGGDGSNFLALRYVANGALWDDIPVSYSSYISSWAFGATIGVPMYIWGNQNLDLKTKGTDEITEVSSPSSAPAKGHIEALVDDRTINSMIKDASSSPHTITAIGDAAASAAQKKIGTHSLYFPKTSANINTQNYFAIEDNATWDYGTGDFTWEMWVKVTAIDRQMKIFGSQGWSNSGAYDWVFDINPNRTLRVQLYNGSAAPDLNTTATLPVSVWTHVAVSRSSGTMKIFMNGVESASATRAESLANNGTPYLGWKPANNQDGFAGYMDEVRFSNTARYTSAFTPSTTAFTSDANTQLLIHGDEEITYPTINTDVKGEMSRDGGTTWSPSTLRRVDKVIAGSEYDVLMGDVDFTGDPSGTNIKARIKTVNKHKVTVKGMAVNWQ